MLKILLGYLQKFCVVFLVMGAPFSIFAGQVDKKVIAKGDMTQQTKRPLCSHHNYSSACYNNKIKTLIKLINQFQKNMTWSRFQVSHKNHSDFWIGNYKTRGEEAFFNWGCLVSSTQESQKRCTVKVFSQDYIDQLTKVWLGNDLTLKIGDSACFVSQVERIYCSSRQKKQCKDKDRVKSVDYLIVCKKITSKHINNGE